jgi:hypothetical protein
MATEIHPICKSYGIIEPIYAINGNLEILSFVSNEKECSVIINSSIPYSKSFTFIVDGKKKIKTRNLVALSYMMRKELKIPTIDLFTLNRENINKSKL